LPDLLERLTAAVAERYRIERELGRGGMATVFLARDLKHSRWVAIKVLDPEVAAAIGPERFLREIGTIASLTHPQILPLYDSGQVDGLLFYVMPYIEGESLRDRLTREKQLPLEDALRITRELADALGYAHGCGVVHRDVKPENILFEQGHAVLADFGIARTESVAGREKLTATGIMVGTPTYMSPEQVAGSRDVEGRSDLYALGCVLYEMLAGQPPFTGPTAESLAYQHVSVSPRAVTELRPGVPAGVAAALQRALAKTPADRYATLAEFVRALGAPSPVQRRRGVRQWLAAGAAVLVAYLAIAIWQHLPPFAPSPRAQPITSVAVLPFANLSGDESQEYYADGMTEALINELGKIGNLKVISRTSVMRFKHTEKSLPEIARTLNVDAVVEASVLRDANNVRVTAQLVRADPEQQLWAESYTRDAADVLVLHSQLARAIADRIRVTVTPVEREQLTRTRRVDPAAYEDYLIGRSLVDKWTRDEVERGIGYLQQALERDPNYAPAYAGLATAYMYSTAPGGGWRSPVEVIDKARAAAERALEMDESLAEAHVALAEVSGLFDWDFGRALRETDRAIELDPGLADARIVKGAVLRRLGGRARYEEALEQLETALRTDPLNPWARGHLMATYAELGDSAKVYEESQKLIDMTPEPLWKAGLGSVRAQAPGPAHLPWRCLRNGRPARGRSRHPERDDGAGEDALCVSGPVRPTPRQPGPYRRGVRGARARLCVALQLPVRHHITQSATRCGPSLGQAGETHRAPGQGTAGSGPHARAAGRA